MNLEKLKQQILSEAVKLIHQNQEYDLKAARKRAARGLVKGYVPKAAMPSYTEILHEISRLNTQLREPSAFQHLRALRLSALKTMRRLAEFDPHVSGMIVSGDPADIDDNGLTFAPEFEREVLDRVRRFDEPNSDTDFESEFGADVDAQFGAEQFGDPSLESPVVTTAMKLRFIENPASSGDNLEEFERLLAEVYPDLDLFPGSFDARHEPDRFLQYEGLLAPLEHVFQSKKKHPEGDALYHSLQVFQLVKNENSYDDDLLAAALLHDVGKAYDIKEPMPATLGALSEIVTERTLWFLENLADAHKLLENTIGARARKRLQESEDFDNLILLARSDRDGRVQGGEAPSLEEALQDLKELAGEDA